MTTFTDHSNLAHPIFEKVELHLSMAAFDDYLRQIISEFEPAMPSTDFGGWSLLSRTGDYRDGWQEGFRVFKESVNGPIVDRSRLSLDKQVHTSLFRYPTQIHRGYIVEVMQKIYALGLLVRRARISVLKANSEGTWHRDALPGQYAVRLHIPLRTNAKCLFLTETAQDHAPADGNGYFVSVNQLHQICNRSDEDRYHFFMDVIDVRGISQRHALPVTVGGR